MKSVYRRLFTLETLATGVRFGTDCGRTRYEKQTIIFGGNQKDQGPKLGGGLVSTRTTGYYRLNIKTSIFRYQTGHWSHMALKWKAVSVHTRKLLWSKISERCLCQFSLPSNVVFIYPKKWTKGKRPPKIYIYIYFWL